MLWSYVLLTVIVSLSLYATCTALFEVYSSQKSLGLVGTTHGGTSVLMSVSIAVTSVAKIDESVVLCCRACL